MSKLVAQRSRSKSVFYGFAAFAIMTIASWAVLVPSGVANAADGVTGLWRTGVTGSESSQTRISTANTSDPHWEVSRVYRVNTLAADTCQRGYSTSNGALRTIAQGPVQGRTILQNASYEGQWNVAESDLTGDATGGTGGPWKVHPSNARWIGMNQYGRSYSDSAGWRSGGSPCKDPTYSAANLVAAQDYANVYVFRQKVPIKVASDVDLSSIKLDMAGSVDDLVKVYINGKPVCPGPGHASLSNHGKVRNWQYPGFADASRSFTFNGLVENASTGGCTTTNAFKAGDNTVEVHVLSTWSHTGLLITKFNATAIKKWNVSTATSVNRTTAGVGNVITWTHRATVSTGPLSRDVNVALKKSNAFTGTTNKTLTKGTGTGSTSWTTSYTVKSSDIGKTFCMDTIAAPRAYNNTGSTPSTQKCVKITVNFKIGVGISVNKTTVLPGDTITWTHSVTNNGPTGTNVRVDYRYKNAQGLGTAYGTQQSGYNLPAFSASGAKKTFTTTYTVKSTDLKTTANKLCRQTVAKPGSGTNSGSGPEVISGEACATVPGNFNLVPTVSLSATSRKPTQSVTATARVQNTMTTTSTSADWRIVRFTVAKGASIPNNATGTSSATIASRYGSTASVFHSSARTFPGSATTTAGSKADPMNVYTVGTRVCFVTSVKPYTRVSAANTWRYSKPSCVTITADYNLTPSISVTPNQLWPTQNTTIKPSVRNAGQTDSASTAWTITRFTVAKGASIPANAVGTSATNAPFTARFGSTAKTFESNTTTNKVVVSRQSTRNFNNRTDKMPSNPVGSRVCYVLSVKPYADSNTTSWRHSQPACVTIIANFNLQPSVTVPAQTVTAGTPIPATPSVVNTGLTTSDPVQWELSYFRVAPNTAIPRAAGGTSAVGTKAKPYLGSTALDYEVVNSGKDKQFGNSGANPLPSSTKVIGEQPVGTQFCFMLSVQPRAHNSNEWRHSPPACVIVARSPKVQVRGGDLIAGRSSVNNNSQIITATTQYTAGQFGSWGEYGVAAGSGIIGMSSGAGLSGGKSTADLCSSDLSLLTFSNNRTTSSTCVGYYKGAAPSKSAAVANFFSRQNPSKTIASASPDLSSATFATSGVYKYAETPGTLHLKASSNIPVGKWIVLYAPSKTVIVDSNVTYATSAISDAKSIPQVIIIANKVVVSEPVSQVDSWVVTRGTANYLATCNIVPASSGATNTLNTNKCGSQLRMNGPVMTDTLFLRRTFGVDTGDRVGAAAEIFNARPDAALWMLANFSNEQKLPTASTKDLPPRF